MQLSGNCNRSLGAPLLKNKVSRHAPNFLEKCLIKEIRRMISFVFHSDRFKISSCVSLMLDPGQKLRALRESLGLTLRNVESASAKLAREYANDEFAIPFSRLFGFEAKGVVPSIYRLYALSAIYHVDFHELMRWYGVDVQAAPADLKFAEIPVTHRLNTDLRTQSVRVPMELDTRFNPALTVNFTMLVRKWGSLPMAFLSELSKQNFLYAYVGTEDYTMHPLIMPGSFLQVDESRCRVVQRSWRSEYERPVYLVETRHDGFRVGWCSLAGPELAIHPHPLSPTSVKSYRYPQDAEVIGQVVGISMRMAALEDDPPGSDRKVRREASSGLLHNHPIGSVEKQQP